MVSPTPHDVEHGIQSDQSLYAHALTQLDDVMHLLVSIMKLSQDVALADWRKRLRTDWLIPHVTGQSDQSDQGV